MLLDSKSKRLRRSRSSASDVPILPVPLGLYRCLVCDEWRGAAKAIDIFGPKHHFYEDEAPERPVKISCICDGIPCRKCKKT
jgi:hypothetical protein